MINYHPLISCKPRTFFALCFCLAGIFTAATQAKADASIVVDASQTQAQCGGCDDLATLQNMFQGANVAQEPAYAQMNQIVGALKMKRVRLLQGDALCDIGANGKFGYTFDGKFHANACYPLLTQLQWVVGNNLSPHVPLASFMPASFTASGPGEAWADGGARFRNYADLLVRYIVSRSVAAGVPSVVFEISNELDLADPEPVNWNPNDMSRATLLPLGPYGRFLWWINPNSYSISQWPPAQANSYPYSSTGLAYPYGGDARRLDHGISPVHQIFAQAVADVSAQFSGSKTEIIMAGPAFAGQSFTWNPQHGLPTLEEDFLDQMLRKYDPTNLSCSSSDPTCNGQFNSRLDRFSFHYYGSSATLVQPNITLEAITGTIQKKLQSLGQSTVKLFMSEWGPTANEGTDVNYSHKGAAWAAAFLPEAVAAGIEMGSYLSLEDGTTFVPAGSDGPWNRGQASLMAKFIANGSVVYYPKPAANVFQMFAMMTGTRRPATVSALGGSNSNLGAFAASDASSAHVVVYNYNPMLVFFNDNNSLPDTPENVSVALDNLPFNGTVTVQRYLVDATTSNFKAFLTNPAHPDPNLQMVEQFSAQVYNGQLTLTPHDSLGQPVSLGLGVTYWRVGP
jgi:hypothetical protein